MLRHTFIHAPGVGAGTERWLWRSGIRCWQDFLAAAAPGGLGPTVRARIASAVRAGEAALGAADAGYFQTVLPSREAWRIFGEFRDAARFLDIETSGLSRWDDRITVIGVSDGREARAYVAGRDLDRFEESLEGAALLVTFNGKGFDVPFIRRQFPGARLPRAHIDLLHTFRAIGIRGGLKNVERQVGIGRGDLDGVDGAVAVALWRRHEAGDPRALAALVRYNLEDVMNLKQLMEWAYNRMITRAGAPAAALAPSPHPTPRIEYSREVVSEAAADAAAIGLRRSPGGG